MHRRVVRFRAAVLPELLIGTLLTLCLLPIALVLALIANALGAPVPGFDELIDRAWQAHHELILIARDGQGEVAQETVFRPADEAEADRIFARALAEAAALGVPLVETRDGTQTLAVWAAGRPLAEPEGGPDAEWLRQTAENGGYTVTSDEDGLTVTARTPHTPPAAALVMLLLITPFALPFARGRERLWDLVCDLRGLPPETLTLRADAAGLALSRARFGAVRQRALSPRAGLLGLRVLAIPSYGDKVEDRSAALHVRGDPSFSVILPGTDEAVEAARALLARALVERG